MGSRYRVQALLLLAAAACGLFRVAGGAAGSPQRLLSVSDVQVVEGDSGTRLAVFTLTLAAPGGDEGVRIAYTTGDGSGSAGSDYTPTSDVMTFPASGGAKTVAVPVVGDTSFEPDETFSLLVTEAHGATIVDAVGVATVVNDDPAPTAPAPSPPSAPASSGQPESGGQAQPASGGQTAAADLELAVTASTMTATVGQQIAYTAVVGNRGPGNATNVVVTDELPAALKFTSAAIVSSRELSTRGQTPTPAACAGTTTVTCPLGTLAAGESTTLRLVTTATQAGRVVNKISVAAAEADPSPANNAGQSTAQVAPLQPVQGRLLVGRPVTGVVLINGRPLVSPRTIPVGARVDTTRGTIDLQATTGRGKFYGGLFQVGQKRKKRAFADLRLVGGNFKKICGKRALASDARRKQPAARHLWGDAKGGFTTQGRYASATVRGTIWDVADRCDGTLVTVRRGRVFVRDIPRRVTVIVTAGNSYLARKP